MRAEAAVKWSLVGGAGDVGGGGDPRLRHLIGASFSGACGPHLLPLHVPFPFHFIALLVVFQYPLVLVLVFIPVFLLLAPSSVPASSSPSAVLLHLLLNTFHFMQSDSMYAPRIIIFSLPILLLAV